ncbi:MAG: restriction endonuclease subunit S [Hormoscilla sp. GUM202]|nr:restriction endonuclease subunit S [Hormoscilla sp. GUM202]
MSKHQLAIDNIQVPEGYKKTEVGVIPEDWEVIKLGDILKIWHGKSQHEIIDPNGIYPILATGGEIGRTNTPLYSEPSVLIGRKGTIDSPRYMNTPFWTVDTLFYSEIFNNTDAKFVFYKFHLIDWYSYNEASGVPSLKAATIEDINQAFPALKEEQYAIAQTLSDVDGLIAALDKAIAKKRNIKTATMQELLTGKKRLPGFGEGKGYKNTEVGVIPEDWRCLRISEVVVNTVNSIKIGPFGSSLKREYLTRTGYKVYGQENIYERDMSIGERFINEERFIKLKSCEICSGDFLISMMGTVGKCMVVPEGIEKGIMDSHLLRLRLDDSKIDSSVLTYLFESKMIVDQVKLLAVGGVMEGLSSKIIKSIYLPLASLLEQRAIASILSDMDAEIAALEKRRAKTQAMKQGMMQELLTGKTRLAVSVVEPLIVPNNP